MFQSLLLFFVFASAQALANPNSILGQIGRCAVQVVEDKHAIATDVTELTELVERARNSYSIDELTAMKGKCEKIVERLSRLSPQAALAQRIENGNYYNDYLLFRIMSAIGGHREFWDVSTLERGVTTAKASELTKSVVRSFYKPIHWCGQAQASVVAGAVSVAGKVGISVCTSTTGDRWIEFNPSFGWSVGGVAQAQAGGGYFYDEGSGSLIQYTESLAKGRAMGTGGLGERRCEAGEKCQYGDLTDVIYGYYSVDNPIIGIGLGWSPNGTSAKLYNLRVKLIPIFPAVSSLGDYMRSARF